MALGCAHKRLATRPKGPHIEQFCEDCGRHIKFVRQVKDSTTAARFVMPIGKHKGKKLEDIPFSYLKWMVENGSVDSIVRACKAFLSGFNPFEIEAMIAAEARHESTDTSWAWENRAGMGGHSPGTGQ